MNLQKVRLYIEALGVSFIITSIFYVIPLEIYLAGEPRLMTVFTTLFLSYVTYNYNQLFHELWDRWFGKK
ncbi:hypothetical protein ABMB67_003800 [Halalkalibacter oceani]